MNVEAAIQWFIDRKGKVTYSMVSRNGPGSYDCSSAVYHALVQAGSFPASIAIGNTDSEFGDLERHGFSRVAENAQGGIDCQRGDVFIWGHRGSSTGAFGHTGIFTDADNIIHCAYGYNGIAITNHDWLWNLNGQPEVTVYRFTGNAAPTGNQVDQIVEVGSWIKFDGTYKADDVQLIGNTWQVRTNQLCSQDFTWEENGIPAALLTEVDSQGYATDDQELAVGSLYKMAGKFNVLDVGETNGRWLAQVGAGGMTFWVDIETATEIGSGDAGTPVPSKTQAPVVATPVAPTPEPTPVVEPVKESPTPAKTSDGYADADRQRDAGIAVLLQKIWDFLASIFKVAK